MIAPGAALRLGGRAAWRAPHLVALRVAVEVLAVLAGAAPLALIALSVVSRLAPASARDLLQASQPLARALSGLAEPAAALSLGGLAVVAFVAAALVRLLYLGGAVASLAEDVARSLKGGHHLMVSPLRRFATLSADRFERMVLFAPVALAGGLMAAAWSGGVAGAALVIFTSHPSVPAALAAALGLTLAVLCYLVAQVVGRLAVVRIGLAGEGPGVALWNAAALLWRAPGQVVGVLLATAVADLAVGTIGLVVYVPGGEGRAALALAAAAFLGAALVQIALGALVDLWRYAALAAVSASAEGLIPEPGPRPVEAQIIIEAVELAPPPQPVKGA